MIDLDEIFAEGNYIGVKKEDGNKVYYHRYGVTTERYLNCYRNENLEDKNDDEWFVYKVIRLNNEGKITNVIFDRNRDLNPMPKIENGMKLYVDNECYDEPQIGIVVNNKIYYQDGGWDYVINKDFPDNCIYDNIIAIYDDGYGFNYKEKGPIWTKY